MMQFINSLQQIRCSESVGTIQGVLRHLQWQFRRSLNKFPCELPIGNSILYVERPNGVAALVNCMGTYDYNNMNLLRLLMAQEKRTFFDIGANIGSYTLIASEDPGATVVSFEPHPVTFRLLQRNVQRNGRSNVRCLNVALSDHAGEVRFTDGPESSINRVVEEKPFASAALRVPARRLDSICDELGLQPDFVKIDVEGHEDAVLRGFGKAAGKAKVIIVEGGDRTSTKDHLRKTGYRGPYFVHFRLRAITTQPQARMEDPIFIQGSQFAQLTGLDFAIKGTE